MLIALAAVLGASSLALYPLSSSHAQDLGGRANAVEVSSGLLLPTRSARSSARPSRPG